MKNKTILLGVIAVSALMLASLVMAGKPNGCTRIQDGVLTYSTGHYLYGTPMQTGYDSYGYNYQAHLSRGSYANIYLGRDGLPPYEGDDEAYLAENPDAEDTWYWPYRSTQVLMKWNDAWISNRDCDGDESLDRHYGSLTYIGSGAWETNHMWDEYPHPETGETCYWDWFVKIVAVPENAYCDSRDANEKCIGKWWTEEGGSIIGLAIWGDFAETMSVYNDPCLGAEGVEYHYPPVGFGLWK